MYQGAYHAFVMAGAARDSLVVDYGVDPSCITVVGGGVNFETLPDPPGPAQEPTVVFVGRDLERKGAVFVEEETEVPEGATVVLSAHGVAPEVHANASARQLSVIDAARFSRRQP